MIADRLPSWVQTGFSALYLNVMWLLLAVPLVTMPAATGALLASMHRWQTAGEPPSARTFAQHIRKLFWRSQFIGAVIAAAAVLAWANIAISGQFGEHRRIFLTLMFAVLLNAGTLTVFWLPSLAADDVTVREALRRAVRLTARSPLTAVVACAAAVGLALASTAHPAVLAVSAVAAAGAVEACRRRASQHPTAPVPRPAHSLPGEA